MEKLDQNGAVEGDTLVQSLEEAEEAEEFSEKVDEEVIRVKESTGTTRERLQKEAVAAVQESEEEFSQQEISRTSDFEEEVSDGVGEDRVNGRVVEGTSDLETEELISERQILDFSEGTQGTEEVIEVADETETVEERQETLEEVTQGSDEEVVSEREISELPEEEEERVPERKKIQYVEEDVDDLEFSDGPDTQEPETEGESAAEFLEEKQDAEAIVVEESEEQEQREEEVLEEQPQIKEDQVDGELETKEPVQSVKTEEVIPTKDLKKTKEPTKEKKNLVQEEAKKTPEGLQRRRSSTENFQKLKDRFSNGTKVEENNRKNAEREAKSNKEKENEKARGAINMSEAKSKRFGGTSEKCTQCNRTVYPMEKMEVAGRLLHKTCFKCCKCNSQLNVGRFSIGGKDMYCMTHYKQAFREKGTYDVFTPDNPIKGKWENK